MMKNVYLLFLLVSALLLLSCFTTADESRDINGIEGVAVGTQTDAEGVEREGRARVTEGYSQEELAAMKAAAESHQFEAEVHQLMDIIINSLYSNREVFLRELISNASDALDKIRFRALTDASVLGEQRELDIRVKASGSTLSVIDTGIGMTKEELVENLGTIAKSGTKAFLSAAQEGADSNLIGQFGVGFYSAFLVADRVRVTSKSNDDDTQWVWESDAQGGFTVTADPRGNTLGRGSEVTLFLKDDAISEFTEEEGLDQLIRRFSEFINFPIYLWQAHEEERVIPKKSSEDTWDEDGVSVEEVDEEDPAFQEDEEDETYLELVYGWGLVNEVQPIWTRETSEITDEEYNSFYRSISSDYQDPVARIHFKAEGDVNFRSILFAPPKAPSNVFDGSYVKQEKPLKLYVKRVFITDDFEDMMPKYLSFVRGIVDSDDINLNVSREILQQSKTLAVIKKKLVRKAIAMFQQLAEDEPEQYNKFFEEFGTHLKWGLIDDRHNKGRLEKLLRFWSSTEGALTSIDEYIDRMKDGQDQIFYLAGNDRAALESSPLMERLVKRGYEVLFMTDPIDEYVTQQLTKYAGVQLTNIAKENLHLDDVEKETEEQLAEDFVEVVDYVREKLGDKVIRVAVTTRLTDSPSALVSSTYGWTANMERLAKAQALADKAQAATYRSRRVLELNPFHPIIVELQERIRNNPDDNTAEDVAQLIYHSALLTSGFELDDPNSLSSHLQRLMMEALTIDPAAEFSTDLPPLRDTSLDNDEDDDDDEENIDLSFEDLKDEL